MIQQAVVSRLSNVDTGVKWETLKLDSELLPEKYVEISRVYIHMKIGRSNILFYILKWHML